MKYSQSAGKTVIPDGRNSKGFFVSIPDMWIEVPDRISRFPCQSTGLVLFQDLKR